MSARGEAYKFKITLRGLKPAVWRRIEVPANYSLQDLHVFRFKDRDRGRE